MAAPKDEHPLRAWRTKRGVTQDELAAAARTTKGTISRIEGGTLHPAPDLMWRLIGATKGEVIFTCPTCGGEVAVARRGALRKGKADGQIASRT